jgi:hypothetical protein
VSFDEAEFTDEKFLLKQFVLLVNKGYFLSRLVWLAAHCQRPWVYTQVSVKRPKCSYGFPW